MRPWLLPSFLAALWRRIPVRGLGRVIDRFALPDATRVRDTTVALGPSRVRVSAMNPPELTLFLWCRYEEEVMSVIATALGSGMVAVDVGANCGVLSVAMRNVVGPAGRVLSIDPSPAACRRVVEQAELNGFTNVEPVCVALGERPATSSFSFGQVGIGALPPADAEFTTGEAVPVEITTLDALLHGQEGRTALLKIDTDGSEPEVLRGARATLEEHRPAIAFELSTDGLARRGSTPADIASVLSAHDYRLFEPVFRRTPAWSARPAPFAGLRPRSLEDLANGLVADANLVAVPALAEDAGNGAAFVDDQLAASR